MVLSWTLTDDATLFIQRVNVAGEKSSVLQQPCLSSPWQATGVMGPGCSCALVRWREVGGSSPSCLPSLATGCTMLSTSLLEQHSFLSVLVESLTFFEISFSGGRTHRKWSKCVLRLCRGKGPSEMLDSSVEPEKNQQWEQKLLGEQSWYGIWLCCSLAGLSWIDHSAILSVPFCIYEIRIKCYLLLIADMCKWDNAQKCLHIVPSKQQLLLPL